MMPVEERERRSPLWGQRRLFLFFFSGRMMNWIVMYLHSNTPPPSPLFTSLFVSLEEKQTERYILIFCFWPFCPCPCLGFCICLCPSCFRVIFVVYVLVSAFAFVLVLVLFLILSLSLFLLMFSSLSLSLSLFLLLSLPNRPSPLPSCPPASRWPWGRPGKQGI